ALMPRRFRMLTPRRLVQFIRPNDWFITIGLKRIFPRSDPPQTSEISEVCVRRNSVPIQHTPIRPIFSAEGIHKVRRGSYRPITSTRLTRLQLFGRLVN